MEKKYYELADKTKKQISNLTDQHTLDEVEKDYLRLAVRLQHSLIDLMWDIDRDPTEAALNKFVKAVELTNNFLCKINEELICVPSDYYARNLIASAQREIILNSPVDFSNLSNINNEESTEKALSIENEFNQEEISKNNTRHIFLNNFKGLYYFFKVRSTSEI